MSLTAPSAATVPSLTAGLTIVIRPAVDARPPADVWLSTSHRPVDVSPDQPALRLVDADTVEELVTAQPAPTRVPLVVDTCPAGIDGGDPQGRPSWHRNVHGGTPSRHRFRLWRTRLPRRQGGRAGQGTGMAGSGARGS